MNLCCAPAPARVLTCGLWPSGHLCWPGSVQVSCFHSLNTQGRTPGPVQWPHSPVAARPFAGIQGRVSTAWVNVGGGLSWVLHLQPRAEAASGRAWGTGRCGQRPDWTPDRPSSWVPLPALSNMGALRPHLLGGGPLSAPQPPPLGHVNTVGMRAMVPGQGWAGRKGRCPRAQPGPRSDSHRGLRLEGLAHFRAS